MCVFAHSCVVFFFMPSVVLHVWRCAWIVLYVRPQFTCLTSGSFRRLPLRLWSATIFQRIVCNRMEMGSRSGADPVHIQAAFRMHARADTCVYGCTCSDVCAYGCMCVWMHVCMDACVYECMCIWMHVCMDACVYGCMCVWMHVCMDAWLFCSKRARVLSACI